MIRSIFVLGLALSAVTARAQPARSAPVPQTDAERFAHVTCEEQEEATANALKENKDYNANSKKKFAELIAIYPEISSEFNKFVRQLISEPPKAVERFQKDFLREFSDEATRNVLKECLEDPRRASSGFRPTDFCFNIIKKYESFLEKQRKNLYGSPLKEVKGKYFTARVWNAGTNPWVGKISANLDLIPTENYRRITSHHVAQFHFYARLSELDLVSAVKAPVAYDYATTYYSQVNAERVRISGSLTDMVGTGYPEDRKITREQILKEFKRLFPDAKTFSKRTMSFEAIALQNRVLQESANLAKVKKLKSCPDRVLSKVYTPVDQVPTQPKRKTFK